jgi:hypothetical protein
MLKKDTKKAKLSSLWSIMTEPDKLKDRMFACLLIFKSIPFRYKLIGNGCKLTGDSCNMTGDRYIFICTGFSMMGGACIVERKVTIKEMEEITTEPQGTQRGKPQPKRTRLALKLQITKYKLQNCRSN